MRPVPSDRANGKGMGLTAILPACRDELLAERKVRRLLAGTLRYPTGSEGSSKTAGDLIPLRLGSRSVGEMGSAQVQKIAGLPRRTFKALMASGAL